MLSKKFFRIGIVVVCFLLAGAYLLFFMDSKDNGKDLVLYGNVDIRQVNLGFRVGGRVQAMQCEEGDVVSVGQSLAVLDVMPYLEEVKEAEARVASAEAALDNAKRIADRREILIAFAAVTKEDLEGATTSVKLLEANLKEARAALGSTLIRFHDTELLSPSNGTIITRIREQGAVVGIGESVYTLSLDTPVWIRAYVSEPHLGRVFPGMKALVTTDTATNKVYEGHIGFISPVAEFTPKEVETTDLRTSLVFRLRIIVDNADKGLRQGMPVTVTLKAE